MFYVSTMQISFTAKIPINTCSILNKETGAKKRATMYEIDCKNQDDVFYFKNIEGNWTYLGFVSTEAFSKYLQLSGKRPAGIYGIDSLDRKFYSLETQDGEIAGICEIQPCEDDINIRYLESNPSKKYKFAGQAMLASIAKTISDTKQNMQIRVPSPEAVKFYSEVCGFKENHTGFGYELTTKDMPAFIQRTEEKTKGKITNIIG